MSSGHSTPRSARPKPSPIALTRHPQATLTRCTEISMQLCRTDLDRLEYNSLLTRLSKILLVNELSFLEYFSVFEIAFQGTFPSPFSYLKYSAKEYHEHAQFCVSKIRKFKYFLKYLVKYFKPRYLLPRKLHVHMTFLGPSTCSNTCSNSSK